MNVIKNTWVCLLLVYWEIIRKKAAAYGVVLGALHLALEGYKQFLANFGSFNND